MKGRQKCENERKANRDNRFDLQQPGSHLDVINAMSDQTSHSGL